MTIRFFAICVFITSLGMLSVVGTAQASCNVIPDMQQTIGGTPQGQVKTRTIPKGLPYRGAIGRIEKATLDSDPADFITVGPDDHCSGRPFQPLVPGTTVGPNDLVAMLLYERGDGVLWAQVYAPGKICKTLNSPTEQKKLDLRINCKPADDNLRIVKPEEPGPDRLQIPSSTLGTAGPVSLVVVAASESGIANLPIAHFATGDCASLAAGFAETQDGYICIDTIYDDYVDRCGVGPEFAAIVPANLQKLPAANVFQEQCYDPKRDDSLSVCKGDPVELRFAVDKSGAVQIPFDWTEIQKTKSGDRIRRVVAGLSGTGRKEQGKDPEIWIPGREFLGSTAPDGGASTKRRKPEVDVWPVADRPNEFGLIGSTDKKRSNLHIYPRLLVAKLCDSYVAKDEACLAVDVDANWDGFDTCANQDRSGAGATCRDVDDPRFAACNGGPYDGMPCTRPRHCGPRGICGQAFCQEMNAVWEMEEEKGTQQKRMMTATAPVACLTDKICARDGKKCGFSLFKVEDRSGVLTAEIIKNGKKTRRGACAKSTGPKKHHSVCNNAGPGKSCPGGDKCVGYRLEAHEAKK